MLMANKQSDDATTSETDSPQTNWQFKSDSDQSVTQSVTKPKSSNASVSWTASEFIAHAKNANWYLLLAIGTVIVAGLAYVITRDKISTGMIVIVGIIFGVMASRKPRELPYIVDNQGVQIGTKQYPYNLFRSFSVVQEGAIESIWLMPLKRFMPILTVYFEPKDGDKIVEVLAQYLPVENHQLDIVDKLMHALRF